MRATGRFAFTRSKSVGRGGLTLRSGAEYLPREKDNWDTRAVFIDAKYKAREVWYDRHGKEFHPGIHYYVGGNTKVYGAALLRFRKEDFWEIKHHGGISPAWPITYEDLEPYYTKAERLYQVHGERGLDPTEPPASEPYLHPPGEQRAAGSEVIRGLPPYRALPVLHPAGHHAR